MGYQVIKEMFCDSCNKEFKREHDYRMHNQIVGGGSLMILKSRINGEDTLEGKLYYLYDWFLDSSTIGRLIYDESLIRCVINAMRNRMIHCESESDTEHDWYCSDDELADFIEANIPTIKTKFNELVQKHLDTIEAEYKSTKKILTNKFV